MSIDSLALDVENVLSLTDWLESEEAGKAQRHLEERIMNLLFSHDSSSPAFQRMAAQLAWLGSQPAQKSLLEKEIIALNDLSIEQCGLFKEIRKGCSKVGRFVADHAVEILVGAAIVATGVGIAAAAGYTLSASVGGVVVAGTGAIYESWKEDPCPKIPYVPAPASKEELALFGQALPTTVPKIAFPASAQELLITPDGIWANGQFFSTEALKQSSTFSSILTSPGLDWKTFTYYTYLSEHLGQEASCQARGESALALGRYHQAVQDFGKAIETNPENPTPYLERGIAQFHLGQYEPSFKDYEQYTSEVQKNNPPSLSEFGIGFAKGLPKGVYESGEGMLLFFVDFATHPIQTSKQVSDSITALVKLVRNDEWGTLTELLSPEMHQLVTQWDTLPSDQRGELAGYTVGKLGADILAPGAIAKIASKSAKAAQEIVAVCKNLQMAQETLVLETAAGVGNGVKIAEVVREGQTMMALGNELGLTAREMGQLKQAGKLEGAINSTQERIASNPVLRESCELFDKAQKFLKPYVKEVMPEAKCRELIHQTGIPTFPRPTGIPENFRVQITDKGAGLIYMHPEHTHTSIRVMPGKPHSPFPYQQKPYVIHMKDGKALDKFGNKLSSKELPEAHISYDEFVHRG